MVTVGVLIGLAIAFVLLWSKASYTYLRRLFGLDLKATREQFVALMVILALCQMVIVQVAWALAQASGSEVVGAVVVSIGIGVTCVEQLTVAIRRIRDIGWPVGKTLILGGLVFPVLVLLLTILPADFGLRRRAVTVPHNVRQDARLRRERRPPPGTGRWRA